MRRGAYAYVALVVQKRSLSSAERPGAPYKAEVTAIGGRTGFVQSSDSRLRLELCGPAVRAGVRNKGTNPEQLLAAAYASCFLSAIQQAAREAQIAIPADANVTARIEVGEGTDEPEAAGPIFTLMVDLPGIEPAQRQALVERAHAISRCSRAMRGSGVVRTIAD